MDITSPLIGCETTQICVKECPKESFIFIHDHCNPTNFQAMRERLICQTDVKIDRIQNCQEIEERIKKDDCARWYSESETCKLVISFY